MNFKYLQIQSNVSQAGGREFEPRLPLIHQDIDKQVFIYKRRLLQPPFILSSPKDNTENEYAVSALKILQFFI